MGGRVDCEITHELYRETNTIYLRHISTPMLARGHARDADGVEPELLELGGHELRGVEVPQRAGQVGLGGDGE